MKKKIHAPDTLHFSFACPFCRWRGEVAVLTHFGNDRGRDLRVGDCLFGCGKRHEPRHLYFLESFTCPGCGREAGRCRFVAEIHCLGNRWTAVQTYPACDLAAEEDRVA